MMISSRQTGNGTAVVRKPRGGSSIHYAVGDVHGCLDQMKHALAWCARDAKSSGQRGIVHLLGDYVDRGPRSKETLDFLIAGPAEPWMEWALLRGNHDDMLARVWFDPSDPYAVGWWEHGGQQTLASYGWDPMEHPVPGRLEEWIPEEHARFLASLPLACDVGDMLFVHAGIRPGVPLDEQSERDMMWIRGEFSKAPHGLDKVVVHGHTPSRNPTAVSGRVNLDAGCFAGGILLAAAFDPGSREPRLAAFSAEGLAAIFTQDSHYPNIVDVKDSFR